MNSTAPFFSVIIPTYNRAHLVGKAIGSVLGQEFSDYELIIVDDGSTDNTGEVVARFTDPRIHYLKIENGERGAARNYGQAYAKGKYVNFFDSDDLMYPCHLKVARQLVELNSTPEFFHLGYDFRSEEGEVTLVVDQLTEDIGTLALFDNILSCNGVFVRRDIAKTFPFVENRTLASAEDWELWIRLICRFRLHYSNEVTTSVVGHDQRSLLTIPARKVLARDLLLIELLRADSKVQERYGRQWRRFVAERYTFFMLCLASDRQRTEVISWASKAFAVYPLILVSKRFWASLKKSAITW